MTKPTLARLARRGIHLHLENLEKSSLKISLCGSVWLYPEAARRAMNCVR